MEKKSKDTLPRYSLRIKQIYLDKLGYIAEYEGNPSAFGTSPVRGGLASSFLCLS